MVYYGTVKEGKIEIDDDKHLPEGTRVRIEPSADAWVNEWEDFARRVSEAWKDPRSAVELISDMRR